MIDPSQIHNIFISIRSSCFRTYFDSPTVAEARQRTFAALCPTLPFHSATPKQRLERYLTEAYISGWFDAVTDTTNP